MDPLHEPIDLGDGKPIELVIHRATPPPETQFFEVYRIGPPRKLLGEFNWEAGRGYSKPEGDDVETVAKVIEYLQHRKRRP